MATVDLLKEIEKIILSSQHRPIHPETEQHQAFLKQQLEKITKLTEANTFLDFSKETELFKNNFHKNLKYFFYNRLIINF